eukprot:172353_1
MDNNVLSCIITVCLYYKIWKNFKFYMHAFNIRKCYCTTNTAMIAFMIQILISDVQVNGKLDEYNTTSSLTIPNGDCINFGMTHGLSTSYSDSKARIIIIIA